jgi:UDP-N-acetylglucosamine 2-epimerase (non-hydrolysing)
MKISAHLNNKLKMISVVGARPNFMKIAPICGAIRDHNAKKSSPEIISVLVHTGQHYDEEMSRLFFDELEIPKPDYNLEVGSGSHAFQTAEIMKRIEPVFLKEQPDYTLVVGDVNSTIAAALVAKKLAIKVIHVEAGLRSFDRSMPEEINRILTDAISDLLFITEKSAETNLLKEGVPKQKIHFVGNVMIDTLLQHKKKAEGSDILSRLGLIDLPSTSGKLRYESSKNGLKPFALLTLHRPSNVDDLSKLSNLLEAMVQISKRLEVIFPAHPRTVRQIKTLAMDVPETLKIVNPLGYLDFLKLMANAKLVLTDSGGIQEETTVLGIPCLTLRESTERPVTITEGTNRLVPIERRKIISEVFSVVKEGIRKRRIPNLWDGRAAERIVGIISSNAGG